MKSSTKVVSHRDSMSVLTDKKILIIDDEPLINRTVAAYLRKGGFDNLRQETDSRLVMEAIREYQPEMVLLDIYMPHVNGLELLQQIMQTRN